MSRKVIEFDRVGKQYVLGTFGIKFMKLLKPRYGYLIVLAIMLAELELLHSFSFSTPLYSNVLVYIKHIAFSLLDISSILLLSSLFLRYSNRALVVIHILFSILVLSNIWYVRFFDTYIPFDMYYGGASNMTEFLDSILPVLHFSDIFFIFSNVVVIYILWNKKSNISRFSTCCFSLSLILASIFAIQRYLSTKKNVFRQIIAETNISFSGGLYNYGFIVSYIGDLYFSNSGFNVIYSTKEIQYLSKYINTDNFIVNKETPQNLILIIVESLSSYPLNKSFAEMEITPNINRLIKNASFFSDKMIDQTKYGISSDGQLIYMTGLIPFPNDATIFKCKNNTFKTFCDNIEMFIDLIKSIKPITKILNAIKYTIILPKDVNLVYKIDEVSDDKIVKYNLTWTLDKDHLEDTYVIKHICSVNPTTGYVNIFGLNYTPECIVYSGNEPISSPTEIFNEIGEFLKNTNNGVTFKVTKDDEEQEFTFTQFESMLNAGGFYLSLKKSDRTVAKTLIDFLKLDEIIADASKTKPEGKSATITTSFTLIPGTEYARCEI